MDICEWCCSCCFKERKQSISNDKIIDAYIDAGGDSFEQKNNLGFQPIDLDISVMPSSSSYLTTTKPGGALDVGISKTISIGDKSLNVDALDEKQQKMIQDLHALRNLVDARYAALSDANDMELPLVVTDSSSRSSIEFLNKNGELDLEKAVSSMRKISDELNRVPDLNVDDDELSSDGSISHPEELTSSPKTFTKKGEGEILNNQNEQDECATSPEAAESFQMEILKTFASVKQANQFEKELEQFKNIVDPDHTENIEESFSDDFLSPPQTLSGNVAISSQKMKQMDDKLSTSETNHSFANQENSHEEANKKLLNKIQYASKEFQTKINEQTMRFEED